MPIRETRAALKRWGFSRKATFFLYAEILLLALLLGLVSESPIVSLVVIVGMAIVLRFKDLSMAVLGILSLGWGLFIGVAIHASSFGPGAGIFFGALVFGLVLAVHVIAVDHLHCTGEDTGSGQRSA